MYRFAIKLAAASVLILPYTLSFAQDVGSFLRDSKIPQRIKPSDLGDDMRAVKIGVDKQGNDFMSLMMSPLMMLGSLFGGSSTGDPNPEAQAASRFFDMLSVSWTNGSTVSLYGQEFLVTYAPQVDFGSISKSKSPPDISKLDLNLTLISTKSITTITPRPDMTKAEWTKEVTPQENLGSKKSATLSNLKQLALGVIIYATDYDDELPYVQSTKGAYEVIFPYIKNKDVTKSLNPNGGEFRLNMAVAGVSMTSIEAPSDTPLFYEMAPWPDGTRCVAYTDGHVKFLNAEQWEKLQPYLNLKLKRTGKPLPATLGSNWETG